MGDPNRVRPQQPGGATVTLTEFLLERIAEDEATTTHIDCVCEHDVRQAGCPARILDECEAKRQIVEWHERGNSDGYICRNILCPHLAALALVYADHPDYRDEWRS